MSNESGSLEKIVQIYNDLNKAEKKVAKYILENPRDIIHFSITELAEESGVSETTVFRVCNKLGYKGYQDLKINLAGEIIKPIENIHEEVREGDDTYLIMQKILKSNISSLDNTLRLNEPEKIMEASKITLNAKQLMFFGMGGSFPIAEDAHHKFIRLGKICNATSDSHWQAMLISLASEDDVVYAFSNSGSNKELLENIRLAKENNLKVISITANPKSPIAMESDISLIAYGKESLFRSEAMESRVSALMIIDWIYVNSAMINKDEALGNLEKIRKGIASKRL